MLHRFEQMKNDAALRARIEKRAEIVAAIRAWFRAQGFFEVETPTLVASPGMEPHLSPFTTMIERENGRAYGGGLITSPEYAMKKLLAAGFPRVFELARCYRNNEPWDGGHNPEFTMLEWYRADADYTAIMADAEAMVAHVAKGTTGGTEVRFGGAFIELGGAWERMTVVDAFRAHAGFDLDTVADDARAFIGAARSAGFEIAAETPFEDAFFKVFLTAVEPKLGHGQPTILYDWPASMAALSRLKPSDARFAERFEVYVGGIELANAFSELNDAAEQRRRLTAEQERRRTMGKRVFPIDEEFLAAVGQMPDSAGIALGVDRLVMLLTDAPSIRDVLAFPAVNLFGEDE